MEGSVLSFRKAEWKVSDTGHWASSLLCQNFIYVEDIDYLSPVERLCLKDEICNVLRYFRVLVKFSLLGFSMFEFIPLDLASFWKT